MALSGSKIMFRHMRRSAYVEEVIQDEIDKMTDTYPFIRSCSVVVDKVEEDPAARYHIQLRFGIGHEVVFVNKENKQDGRKLKLRTLLLEAFDNAAHQLDKVKTARVAKRHKDDDKIAQTALYAQAGLE